MRSEGVSIIRSSEAALPRRLRSICARSQLREITAWACRSGSDECELISLEITLVRYSSTPRILMAVSMPPRAISLSDPRNR